MLNLPLPEVSADKKRVKSALDSAVSENKCGYRLRSNFVSNILPRFPAKVLLGVQTTSSSVLLTNNTVPLYLSSQRYITVHIYTLRHISDNLIK